MPQSKTICMIAIIASASMLFVGVVEDKANHILLPFAILAGCSIIGLAICERKPNDS